jgi:hypothetical protein
MSSTMRTFTRYLFPIAAAAMLIITACSEMDQPVTPQKQAQQELQMIQLDPGVTQSIDPTASLRKSFSTQTLCPLNGLRIAYDMSHNSSGRQGLTSPTGGNGNSIIFGDYTARGASITVITTFDAGTLSNYDVLWLEEDFSNDLSTTERAVLQAYVENGGSVIILAEDWAGASPLIPFGYNYTSGNSSGTTTNLATHALTAGVTTIRFNGTVRGLSEPASSLWIVKNSAGTSTVVSVRSYGAGKVVVMSDELLVNAIVNYNDNRVFGNNLMTWLWTRPVTIDIKPGDYPNSINCSGNGNVLIPVAILSTPTFDATTVDHTTVRFEGAAEKHSHKGVMTRHEEDVDLDGDMDLVLHFQFNETPLGCTSTTGTLTGLTSCGQAITGSDTVNMVP